MTLMTQNNSKNNKLKNEFKEIIKWFNKEE